MMRGTFIDPFDHYPHLKGKTALLELGKDPSYLLAQFDDTSLKEAYGWTPFSASYFTIDPEPDWDGGFPAETGFGSFNSGEM